jgi:2-amino-4-hydroxy-6-hydroxymethyldihydropteridine diphosphokinase
MTLAYIAIGSNLASPLEQVNAAVQALGEIPQSRIVAVSSFYRTPPLGPQDQPDYLNAAVVLETALDAETLLDNTQRIELQQGRVRKAERWGRARWTSTSCCLATRLLTPNVSPFRITT